MTDEPQGSVERLWIELGTGNVERSVYLQCFGPFCTLAILYERFGVKVKTGGQRRWTIAVQKGVLYVLLFIFTGARVVLVLESFISLRYAPLA